jgi:hypothetical protein
MSDKLSAKFDSQYSFFENLYKQNEFEEISDIKIPDLNFENFKIFIGSKEASQSVNLLTKNSISHVLICHPTLLENFPKKLTYSRLPMLDLPDFDLKPSIIFGISFLFDIYSESLKNKNEMFSVLVHCSKGVSRSTSIVRIAFVNIFSKFLLYFFFKKF